MALSMRESDYGKGLCERKQEGPGRLGGPSDAMQTRPQGRGEAVRLGGSALARKRWAQTWEGSSTDAAHRFRRASQGLSVGAAATGRLWWSLYCRLFELSNKGAKVRSARPKNLRI